MPSNIKPQGSENLRFRYFAYLFFLMTATLLLIPGCGGEMSVKDAENLTLAYQGKLFTPPPREINDILNTIQAAKNSNAKMVKCDICDQVMPADASISTKIDMLSHKGVALHFRGQTLKGLAYLNQAKQLMDSSAGDVDDDARATLFNRLTFVNQEAGNYFAALEYARQSAILIGDGKGMRGKKLTISAALAMQYAQVGDIDNAMESLRDARDSFDKVTSKHPGHPKTARWQGDMAFAEAVIAEAEGHLREAETNYREAMRWFKENIEHMNGYQRNHLISIQGYYLVTNLLQQGRVAEAEVESRQAIKRALKIFGRDSSSTATAVMGLARIMLARGRFEDATRLLMVSRDILHNTGASSGSSYYAQNMNLLADAQLAQYNHQGALNSFNENIQGLRGDTLAMKAFINTNLSYAIALMRAQRLDEALVVAEASVALRRELMGTEHYSVKEAQAVVDLLHAMKNHSRQALDALLQALPSLAKELNDQAADQSEPGANAIRFRMIAEQGMALLAKNEVDLPGADESLLQIMQLAQGQAVQRALAASAARASIKDPELIRLVRSEQDVTYKISSAYNALSSAVSESGNRSAKEHIQDVQDQVKDLNRARESIRNEITARFPEYEQLVRPRPASMQQIQHTLRPDESMLAFYFGERQGYVFAIPHLGKMRVATIQQSRAAIDASVESLRKSLDSGATTLNQIPAFDVATAHRLYQQLLAPVASVWQDSEMLAVVPHGSLSSLPLGTLVMKPVTLQRSAVRFAEYREVDWMAKHYAISYVPSILALPTLRKLPPGDPGRQKFAGFGNPVFNANVATASASELATRGAPVRMRGLRRVSAGNLDNTQITSSTLDQLVSLPETANEVREVAAALHANEQQSVFTGALANEEQVESMKLDDRRVIMFATHALLPGDLDGLDQPAIALSSPDANHTKGDGLLTMGEVLGLKLNADWVVLSACNTGAASGKGADAISGLGMAFFYAGSRALLVSHWPVETNSARNLTTDLFRRQTEQPQLSRAESLSETIRAMIKNGGYRNATDKQIEFSYAHPMFWAPFTLVGDGQGSRI